MYINRSNTMICIYIIKKDHGKTILESDNLAIQKTAIVHF